MLMSLETPAAGCFGLLVFIVRQRVCFDARRNIQAGRTWGPPLWRGKS